MHLDGLNAKWVLSASLFNNTWKAKKVVSKSR